MASPTRTRRTSGPAPGITFDVYWRDTDRVTPAPALSGTCRADVAIIGGGFTGLWAAHYLKKAQPDLAVVVLESEFSGAGASGHGDGFMTPTIGHNLAGFLHAYGTDSAKVAYALTGKSILEIQRFTRRHDIDAEIEPTGYLNVATNARQARNLERDLGLIEQLGATSPPALLGRDEVRERIGSPALIGGFAVGGALVNPYRLVRGLHRVVREQGVEIYEQSAVHEVTQDGSGYQVRTAGGRVQADQVVYATNAYQHRFAAMQSMIRPLWSYAIVTEPLSERQLGQVHWPGREGFVEARNVIAFARLTAGNRLLIGGGPVRYHYGRDMAPRHMRSASLLRLLSGLLATYFPPWRDVRVTHAYGGCIDMTPDLVPHIGRLPTGEFYSHGYCGNGVAFSNTAGKVLRDLVLGLDSAYTGLPFVGPQRRVYGREPLAWLRTTVHHARLDLEDRWPASVSPRQASRDDLS
jgi:glycine/D-amino acid oxidase-like deaminating enzyme